MTGTDGAANPHLVTPGGKPRARSLGLRFGGRPGPWNAITDVPGVEVGYLTRIEGSDIRTGVTAIHPRSAARPGDPVAAGLHAQNGNGEMTGAAWIGESGTFSGPVAITNTHAAGVAHAGIIAWTVRHHRELADAWLMPVAAETWDGYLNDINGHHVDETHVVQALERARSGPIEEGSVGGGTGMNCYGFKGGSGTASRILDYAGRTCTVGVFLQANFGSRGELVLGGVPLGADLAADDPMSEHFSVPHGSGPHGSGPHGAGPHGAGSCIAIVATDAPLFPHQLTAFARRVTTGLARTGTAGSHFSGDLFLAFSVANPGAFAPPLATLYTGPEHLDHLDFLPWGHLDPFYEAVVQATEEAVANALVANEEMTGRDGHRTPALPRDRVAELAGRARARREAWGAETR
ncbi:MAG TPA: P1 family peptidase [Streptosporangiaceae bacterium]